MIKLAIKYIKFIIRFIFNNVNSKLNQYQNKKIQIKLNINKILIYNLMLSMKQCFQFETIQNPVTYT